MTLTTTNNPYSSIDSILDTFFRTDGNVLKSSFRFAENQNFPKLNIYSKKRDDKNFIVVEAAVAGYNPNDIKIEIDKSILSISHSKVEDGWENDSDKVFLNEIKQSSFTRKVLLPDTLDFDTATVEYKNGVLSITIQEDVKRAPKILKITA